MQDLNLLTGQKQYCFQFPFDECLECYQPHEQQTDYIQNAADHFFFAESATFPYQGAACHAFLSTSQEANPAVSLGCQILDDEQQQNAEHRTSRMSLKDSPCETVWSHSNNVLEGPYNDEEAEINEREHVRDDIETPTSVSQKIPHTLSPSVNSNRSEIQQMQPEPASPKGLSLACFSEEEQVYLLSMAMAPNAKTPAPPKVSYSNKGTKRAFADANNSLTPVGLAPGAEDSSSKLQNANLEPTAKAPALPKAKKVRFYDS